MTWMVAQGQHGGLGHLVGEEADLDPSSAGAADFDHDYTH